MQLRARRQGIAMLYALLLLVVVMGVATLMFARTLGEIKQSGDDAGIVQSLMLARGAANLGGSILQQKVRDDLQAIVQQQSSTTNPWSFGTGPINSPYPTPVSVRGALSIGSGSVAGALQPKIDGLLCGNAITPRQGGHAALRIYVTDTACDEPLPSGITLPAGHFVSGQARNGSGTAAEQTYALPFVLIADGYAGSYHRNVVIQGEYDFKVGRSSFAKYALFTNVHELPQNGGNVWFTDHTLFDGPVHTNQYFRFYRQPWFGGEVTSAGCDTPGPTSCNGSSSKNGAEFYGEGFVSDPGPTPSFTNGYGTQAPQLTKGVDWSSGFVPLPLTSDDQKNAAQDHGLYFNGDVSSLTMWAADDHGNPLTKDASGNWTPAATYQYIQACTGDHGNACTTYRYGSDDVLYQLQSNGSWKQSDAAFNGVVYANGNVDRLTGPARTPPGSGEPADAPPALASFAQVTVASQGSTQITGDLTYEGQPCQGELHRDSNGQAVPPTCDNLNAANVLGVYAQGGDVLIGNADYRGSSYDAPQDVKIDGVLMSASGTVSVENFRYGSPRGSVHLLGGIIEYNYGAFGTFSASSGLDTSGYSRKFTYDQRMHLQPARAGLLTRPQDG
ncbi:MAG: DUF4900 domain-containing protein [Deinococcales bacterium]